MIDRTSPNSNDPEHSVWVKNWGPFPDPNHLPPGVNTINIFEGKIDFVNGHWVIDGLDWSAAELTQYINACHAKGITVKISLGGAGGQAIYNNTWDQLSGGNVAQMGKDLAAFCSQLGVDGIDFDYEEQKDDTQRNLVGQLIGYFKQANPSLLASVCTDAGNEGSGYIWPQYLGQILDAATAIYGGTCPVNQLYVMSYDYSMGSSAATLAADETFMKNWSSFGEKYGIGNSQISVGVDPTENGLTESDRALYLQFAHENGFGTAVWDQIDYNEGDYTWWVYETYEGMNGTV